MTVPDITDTDRVSGPYTATAAQVNFTVTFVVLASSLTAARDSMRVTVNGTEQSLSAWSFAGNSSGYANIYNGGTLTSPTAMAGGEVVVIWSDMPVKRDSEFIEGAAFPAATLDTVLNQQTAQARDIQQQITSFVRRPFNETALDMLLPVAGSRGSRVMGFDSSGRPVAGALISNIDAAIAAFVGGTSIGTISSVGSIATLEALTGMADKQVLYVIGYYANSRVGGGYFQFVLGDATTVNGVTVFTAVGGRWFRIYYGALHVTMAGAKTDGTDATAAFQATHDALPSGGGAIYAPGGQYSFLQTAVAGQFKITKSNVELFGDGPATQFYKSSSGVVVGNQGIIMLYPATAAVENIVLRDFRVTGPTPSTGAAISGDTRVLGILYHGGAGNNVLRNVLTDNVIIEKMETAGFAIAGVSTTGYNENLHFRNCTARNLRQDGYNDFGGEYDRGITFENCYAYDCDGFGYEMSGSRGFAILGGIVERCGQAGIGTEAAAPGAFASSFTIANVLIRDIGTTAYPNGSGISLGQSVNPHDMLITGNTIQRTGGDGIICNLVPDKVIVTNNKIIDVGKNGVNKNGIFGFNGTNCAINNNDISTSGAGYTMDYGVVVQGNSATNEVKRNRVVGAAVIPVSVGDLVQRDLDIQAYLDKTTVGNVGVGEDDMMTKTLAANTLTLDKQSIRLKCAGTTAANGNTKQVKLYWNGTVVLDTGALAANAKPWVIEATITRTTSGFAKIFASGQFNGAIIAAAQTQVATTYTGTVVVKCTGGATADNDVTQDLFSMEFVDA